MFDVLYNFLSLSTKILASPEKAKNYLEKSISKFCRLFWGSKSCNFRENAEIAETIFIKK